MSAWIQKGNTVVLGTNGVRQSSKFQRRFSNGSAYCAHAEMDAIDRARRKFNSIEGLDLYVVRFLKNGNPAIAKPCKYCMKYIKRAKIGRVHYTNINGEWETLTI